MKVLMTADTVGGVWTYALELAGALAEWGVTVALATKGAPLAADQRAALGRLRNVELHESAFRLEWMDAPWDDVRRASEWLLGLEARLRPDLVHLNDYAHGALPFRAPVLVVGHSCVLSWWEAVRGAPAPPEWERYRREVRAGLAGADAIAAPSRAMLEALRRHYAPPAPGVVLPNGRDPASFSARAKEPFVLAAGRLWDEGKNLAALARAAPRLSWPVYLAGARRDPDGRETSLAGRHLGRLTPAQLAGWLSRAAIYALPARYEPFGLSPLEAALSGCALVLGDIPSLREVWGEDALYVPPDDERALAAAIERLARSTPLREGLAARARARARRYTARRMAAGYLRLYRRLGGRCARGGPACAS